MRLGGESKLKVNYLFCYIAIKFIVLQTSITYCVNLFSLLLSPLSF